MREFYALSHKGSIQFLVIGKTLIELDEGIQKGFINRKGMSAKGSNYTMDDYMNGKQIVKVTITPVTTE